jgi:starch synthase
MNERPLRILMISAEVESLARTGGLGDVLLALSRALARQGAEILVVTPLYGVTTVPAGGARWGRTLHARIGWGEGDVRPFEVVESIEPFAGGGSVRFALVDDPGLFGRDGIYGDRHGTFGDNDLRFAMLSRASLEIAGQLWGHPYIENGRLGWGPDVVHAHDWHASFALLSAKTTMGDGWARVPAVFTIHNLAFQGVLGLDTLDALGIARHLFADGSLAHQGNVNLLKGAISLADRVTTVSPNYAREILRPGTSFGLDGVLRAHRDKLVGIVNGIDTDRFDPVTDGAISARYDAGHAGEGKLACKRALCQELGLSHADAPLFATVSRLTDQKGIDLLLAVAPHLVAQGCNVALVGQGDAALEQAAHRVAERFAGRAAVRIAFDPSLARRVYAAADGFVVPSRYEPCGLTQMYAMRYGALPVVTPVGGLVDTVAPCRVLAKAGTGFVAEAVSAEALLVACDDALSVFRDPQGHAEAMARAMGRDSSWARSASTYMALFRELRRAAG